VVSVDRGKTRGMRQWEDTHHGQDVFAELRALYVDQGMTLAQVGGLLGRDESTISRWLERAGIPARKPTWQMPEPEAVA
jgi:hypothetical protein